MPVDPSQSLALALPCLILNNRASEITRLEGRILYPASKSQRPENQMDMGKLFSPQHTNNPTTHSLIRIEQQAVTSAALKAFRVINPHHQWLYQNCGFQSDDPPSSIGREGQSSGSLKI